MADDEEFENFSRLIQALGPFLDEVVIVGGWAYRLYRHLPDTVAPAYAPLFTEDADIAIPDGIVLSHSLRDRLRENGFTEEFLGEDSPPITHYRLGNDGSGFYAEFLTPKIGGGGRRGKASQDTTEIAGVIAQKLRHLEILTRETWQVPLDRRATMSRPVDVKVPNPVSFLVQKLLIHGQRHFRDRAKDVLYIHDTIELFSASLDSLRQLWLERIQPTLPDRTGTDMQRLARHVCREDADAVQRASRKATEVGRELTAETIHGVCDAGLRRLFDDDDD